jgi:hypothetical protein
MSSVPTENSANTVRRVAPGAAQATASQATASQATASQATASQATASQATASGGAAKSSLPFPTDNTLQQAFKLSLKLTKPVCTYFYIASVKGKASIETHNGEKIIFISEDECTSPIMNTFKSDNSYIVVTNNTIYLLSDKTVIKA